MPTQHSHSATVTPHGASAYYRDPRRGCSLLDERVTKDSDEKNLTPDSSRLRLSRCVYSCVGGQGVPAIDDGTPRFSINQGPAVTPASAASSDSGKPFGGSLNSSTNAFTSESNGCPLFSL